MTYRTARPEDQREPIDLGAHQRTVDTERVRDAAPELLAALRNVLALALIKFGNLSPEANEIFAKARSAIAKAEPQE